MVEREMVGVVKEKHFLVLWGVFKFLLCLVLVGWSLLDDFGSFQGSRTHFE